VPKRDFERLCRAVYQRLATDEPWRRTDGDDVEQAYARDLGDGLVLSLKLLRLGGDELYADVAISCPAAQQLLERLGSFARAELQRSFDLDIVVDGALDTVPAAGKVAAVVSQAAAGLMRQAGTIDSFLARLRGERYADEVVPAVLAASGRAAEARAAVAERERVDPVFARRLNGWLDGEPLPPGPLSWRGAAARAKGERAAVAAMEALGPYADAAARRAALVEALAEHGLDKSPYWIQLQIDRTRPQGSGWRDFARDALRTVRKIRAIGDEPAGEHDHTPDGRGPWLEVALDGDAHATLAPAFERARIRMMTTANVTAQLRPQAGGEPARVLIDGVPVGRLDTPVTGDVRAQIGRLAGPDRWHLQVQLP
jgi:hypothetical protein